MHKEYTIALCGNPNVGKSTVFNALTGLNQHTGNWTGKTVANAFGSYEYNECTFTLADLPGTYSLHCDATDEQLARDFICFEQYDAALVVIDATCVERNLILVLQILERTGRVVLCVNLSDEAQRKGIEVDIDELSLYLGIPVVATSAKNGKGLEQIRQQLYAIAHEQARTFNVVTRYDEKIEAEIATISEGLAAFSEDERLRRYIAVRLLENDEPLCIKICESFLGGERILSCVDSSVGERITEALVARAAEIYSRCVRQGELPDRSHDRRIDKILTSAHTGIPVMLLLLGLIFWITIVGANYPSQLLSEAFSALGVTLRGWLATAGLHSMITSALIDGVYTTLTWVVSVMLPPMAIFFPLFTLLEDLGYLPRVAFNLDRLFRWANASGKQSLTMCMGFGCNACGIIGARIIADRRERLLAILTNCFVPCNGRFPTIITIIALFFGSATLPVRSLLGAAVLLLVIVCGVLMTFLVSRILSMTVLSGAPCAFTLELPPYRTPKIGSILLRSLLDRTLFVLGRAVAVAAPAGLIIWLCANITISDTALLQHIAAFFEPLGGLVGLDGVIITAFILGLPANEIVLPIMLMGYTSGTALMEQGGTTELFAILSANGWSITTAVCMIIMVLFHFPCATSLLTIYRETKSLRWTAFSFCMPTAVGILVCLVVRVAMSVIL